jgi:hypothetical protein
MMSQQPMDQQMQAAIMALQEEVRRLGIAGQAADRAIRERDTTIAELMRQQAQQAANQPPPPPPPAAQFTPRPSLPKSLRPCACSVASRLSVHRLKK